MKQPIPIQTTLLNAEIPADSIPPLAMRVNCATLAKVLNVSRTSVKRFVDSGLIELDADGLADVKQATSAVLMKSTHVKKRLLKSEIDEAAALRKQITELRLNLFKAHEKLDDVLEKLKESQAALLDMTEERDDYKVLADDLHNGGKKFIDALLATTNSKLLEAIAEDDRRFLACELERLTFEIEPEQTELQQECGDCYEIDCICGELTLMDDE